MLRRSQPDALFAAAAAWSDLASQRTAKVGALGLVLSGAYGAAQCVPLGAPGWRSGVSADSVGAWLRYTGYDAERREPNAACKPSLQSWQAAQQAILLGS